MPKIKIGILAKRVSESPETRHAFRESIRRLYHEAKGDTFQHFKDAKVPADPRADSEEGIRTLLKAVKKAYQAKDAPSDALERIERNIFIPFEKQGFIRRESDGSFNFATRPAREGEKGGVEVESGSDDDEQEANPEDVKLEEKRQHVENQEQHDKHPAEKPSEPAKESTKALPKKPPAEATKPEDPPELKAQKAKQQDKSIKTENIADVVPKMIKRGLEESRYDEVNRLGREIIKADPKLIKDKKNPDVDDKGITQSNTRKNALIGVERYLERAKKARLGRHNNVHFESSSSKVDAYLKKIGRK